MTTQAELDAYDARQKATVAEAAKLYRAVEDARQAIYAAPNFIAHRYASARLEIAIERADRAAQVRMWGYDAGREMRFAAIMKRFKTLRMQVRRARRDYAMEKAA
jgi:hypothetical protein